MQATLLTKSQCSFLYYKSRVSLIGASISCINTKELGTACQNYPKEPFTYRKNNISESNSQETMETNPKGYWATFENKKGKCY